MRHVIAALAILCTIAACTVAPDVNTGTVIDGSATGAPAQEQKPAPTWGQTYKWPNGLAIEIATPVTCKPGQYAMPQNIARAVKVTYKITNGTDQPFSPSVLSVGSDVQFAGAKAETVFDSGGGCKAGIGMESATVMPGKSFTYEVAYAVTKEPGELQIALRPDFGSDKAVFAGQA